MFIGVISHHFNTSPSQPGAQLQKTIFAFLTAQNCELNVSVSAMLVDTRQKKYRSSFYS